MESISFLTRKTTRCQCNVANKTSRQTGLQGHWVRPDDKATPELPAQTSWGSRVSESHLCDRDGAWQAHQFLTLLHRRQVRGCQGSFPDGNETRRREKLRWAPLKTQLPHILPGFKIPQEKLEQSEALGIMEIGLSGSLLLVMRKWEAWLYSTAKAKELQPNWHLIIKRANKHCVLCAQ